MWPPLIENHAFLERVAILFLATLPVYAGGRPGRAVSGLAFVRQMVPTYDSTRTRC